MFQTTSIRRSTPGSGRAPASASIASRVPMREACPAVDSHGMVRPSPRSADLAFDEERAWPHAGRPEPLPLIRPRDQKLPLCPVEQEVGITTRQQTHGRGSRIGSANGRLVVGEQPLVPAWRSDREERSFEFERGERGGRRDSRDPCPPGEPLSRGRPEDVEVASSELEARVGRVNLRGGDGPDGRRSCAIPTDGDRARRCRVPERVRVNAKRAPDLGVRHARALEMVVQLRRDALGPQAALDVVGMPPQREQYEVTLGDDVCAVARSPELGKRRILPRRRPNPVDPRVQREQRGSWHAVL